MNAEHFLRQGAKDCKTAKQVMIEFAKIKVEEALKSAANNAKTKKKEIPYTGARAGGSYFVDVVDTDSILNAYPLKKIK
jgi:hypothetical protein